MSTDVKTGAPTLVAALAQLSELMESEAFAGIGSEMLSVHFDHQYKAGWIASVLLSRESTLLNLAERVGENVESSTPPGLEHFKCLLSFDFFGVTFKTFA